MTGTRPRRRRGRRGRVRAAGARLRARARSSRSTSSRWQAVGADRRLPRRHLRPEGHHDRRRASARPARRTVYVRKRNPQIDTEPARRVQPVRRDLDALHAPRLPGPLRRGRRSASSARATAASTTSAARSTAARRCARSTASTRASRNGQRRDRPALLGQQRARALLAARSRRAARRHRPVPVPVAPLGPQAPRNLIVMPKLKLPAPPLPEAAEAAARSARRGATDAPGPRTPPRRPGITVVDWVDERTSLSRRRALDDVPQGPEGDQLVLHAGLGDDVRLPHPGGHRRLPGDVLRPVADARLRVGRATSPTTPSSASSCAACTSGARP